MLLKLETIINLTKKTLKQFATKITNIDVFTSRSQIYKASSMRILNSLPAKKTKMCS